MHEFIKDTSNCDLVECLSIEECKMMFDIWMGSEVAKRKDIIESDLSGFVDFTE